MQQWVMREHMCVCVSECVCECVRVCVYVYVWDCVSVCAGAYVCVRTRVRFRQGRELGGC